MDWISLVIPLIAVGVYILSHLANQQNETRRPPRVQPPRPREPVDALAAGPKTRPAEDDKYREEMARTREKKTNLPKPQPRPRPRRLEAVRPPPLPAVVTPVTPAVVLPATDPALGPFLAIGAAPSHGPVATLAISMVPAAKIPPVSITNMLELLKKPQNLASVFLLKEVFDLPLAKRGRRRL